MASLQIAFKQTLGCFGSLPTSVAKNAAGVSIDPFPFCTDLPRPPGGVHHSAYFAYQNRNVCLFPHCLNLISPPPLPTSLSVTPLLLSPFLCSHSKLKEGERAREKRLFSCKRHRDERLPTQSVIAGKMGVMYSQNVRVRTESVDFGTPTHEMRGGVRAHFKSMHDQKGLNSSCAEKTNKEAAQLKAPGLN